ncbi:MAG: hypothetical protein RNU03_18685 [Candidatus Sedimenticola sp. (ex Thyasira tokunagai)]
MDFIETALSNAAERQPTGADNCHSAVVIWLFRANLITEEEKNGVLNKPENHPYQVFIPSYASFLVCTQDPILTRKKLDNLSGGNVLGFYERFCPDNLTHSMVTLERGVISGFNNAGVTGGRTDAYKHNRFSTDDLAWGKSQSYLEGYGANIHYQHPEVIANRISRFVAGNS